MESRLLECLFNREHVVLGRELRPYCLWHLLNLKRINSPFLSASGASLPLLVDLDLATRICASHVKTPLSEINPPRDPEERQEAIAKLKDYAPSFLAELAAFHVYHKDHVAPPRFFDREDGGSASSPFEMLYVARLMRDGRMSFDEALMFPFGTALHLIPALMEVGGDKTNVMSDEFFAGLLDAGYTEEDLRRMEMGLPLTEVSRGDAESAEGEQHVG